MSGRSKTKAVKPVACAPVAALAGLPAGPRLAAALAQVDMRAVTGFEAVLVLRAAFRQDNHQRAVLLQAAAEVARRTDPEHGRDDSAQREVRCDEVRAALVLTRTGATTLVRLADTLTETHPSVLAAMVDGRLDQPRARILHTWTEDLPHLLAQTVVAKLLPVAHTKTTAELILAIEKIAIELDPDWAQRRYKKALQTRRVEGVVNHDGTATMTGYNLPADHVAAACDRLDAMARAVKAAGHPGLFRHIAADIYLGQLDGRYTHMSDQEIIAHLVAGMPSAIPDPDPFAHLGPIQGPEPEPDWWEPTDPADDPDPATTGDGEAPARDAKVDTDAAGSSVDGPETGDVSRRDGNTPPGAHEDAHEPADNQDAADTAGSDEPAADDAGNGDAGHGDAELGRTRRAADTRGSTMDSTVTTRRSGDDTSGDDDPGAADEPAGTDNGPDPPDDPHGGCGGAAGPAPDPPDEHRDRPPHVAGHPPDQADVDRAEQCSPAGARRSRRRGLRLVVGLGTVAGLDRRPGELLGFGFLHAELARQVTAAPGASWWYALVQPDGTPLHVGPIRRRPTTPWADGQAPAYRNVEVWLQLTPDDLNHLAEHPPAGWAQIITDLAQRVATTPAGPPNGNPRDRLPSEPLRRWLHIRDRRCTFPGCRIAPHKSDTDHTVEYHRGGPTIDANLGPVCEPDHLLRHLGGWTVRQLKPGHFAWTSPLGHQYRRGLPPGPEAATEPMAKPSHPYDDPDYFKLHQWVPIEFENTTRLVIPPPSPASKAPPPAPRPPQRKPADDGPPF